MLPGRGKSEGAVLKERRERASEQRRGNRAQDTGVHSGA